MSGQNDSLLSAIKILIDEAKGVVSESPKSETLQKVPVRMVERFFYTEVIVNFKDNLVEENLKEFNISNSDLNNINRCFKELFLRCEEGLKSTRGNVGSKDYKVFKEKLKEISGGAFKLLIELEKYIKFDKCEKEIGRFKKEVKKLGKELKIKKFKGDGRVGFRISFE